jgi:hypothetical protein
LAIFFQQCVTLRRILCLKLSIHVQVGGCGFLGCGDVFALSGCKLRVCGDFCKSHRGLSKFREKIIVPSRN